MKKLHYIGVICFLFLASTATVNFSYEKKETPKFTNIKFGSVTIDGIEYVKDVIFDGGEIRQRKKKPSKHLREKYGHTPLTLQENIPWDCATLVIGKGMSNKLPITEAFKKEAKKHGVELIILQTPDAIDYFTKNYNSKMNAIFHITC
jgi:hypothetical protein